MKYMMTLVTGGLFCVFLVIGFRSFSKLADLRVQMTEEQQNRQKAKDWFFDNYSGRAVDVSAEVNDSDEMQQKYFMRSSYMKQALHQQFPDFEDSFLDYLIEHFYEELYILKVDGFINHQVDPELMKAIGEDFARHFKDAGITKVATIESSGIAPALTTAAALRIPLLILKKSPSKVLNDNMYQTVVTSYTKGNSYELTLAKHLISDEDHVLIIDDFLANGEAATGAVRLIRKAHATIAGIGILIEKSFQPGRGKLEEQGLNVYSQVRIGRLDAGVIELLAADA